MMRSLIEGFSEQINHALEIGSQCQLNAPKSTILNVVVCGLGGSGIGGKIISQLVQDHCSVPVQVNNHYTIPAFVNKNTLVVISSYSGNTEETVSAMKEARAKGAEIAVITSGGQVLEIANGDDLNTIVIPGGHPPRSQFGYSIVQQLFIFHHYQLLSDELFEAKSGLVEFLNKHYLEIQEEAAAIAKAINGKQTIIYADDRWEGVAIRWRQQLNENSKLLCWHHIFPELNHNELVGWDGGSDQFAVLMLRTENDYQRNKMRMNISKEWIENKAAKVIEVEAKGDNPLERMLYLVNLGDWVSLLIAEANGTDPVSIEAIDHLKSELAKQP
ncbi:MAG: bifunctional phosphoglucose/phosphomannose isomerase [Flavobacteriales bacterium]